MAVIGFDIKATDRASGAFNNVSSSMKNADAKAGLLNKSISGVWKQFAAGALIATGIQKAISGISSAISGGIRSTSEFDGALKNVSTLMSGQPAIMAEYEKGLLAMSGELGSATELTNSLYQALSAGAEPASALQLVEETAKFAKAALIDAAVGVDVVTTALNAYGMSASQAGHVGDVLFQTIKDGKTTGEQLASTMGNLIPTMATLNISLEEGSAAIATLTKGGISTAEAVTALNSAMLGIIKAGPKAQATAKGLGLDMSKAGIEGAGGFYNWMVKLRDAVGDNTEALTTMFPNVRGLKALFALTGKQAGEFTRIMGNMSTVAGNVNEAFEKQMTSIPAIFSSIKNELEAGIIKALLPVMRDLAKWVRENKEQIVNFISAATKNIVLFIKTLADWAGVAIGIIEKISKAPIVSTILSGWEKIATIPAAMTEYIEVSEKTIDMIHRQGEEAKTAIQRFFEFGKALSNPADMKAFQAIMDETVKSVESTNDAFENFADKTQPLKQLGKIISGDVNPNIDSSAKAAQAFNNALLEISRGKHGESLKNQLMIYRTAERQTYAEAEKNTIALTKTVSDQAKAVISFFIPQQKAVSDTKAAVFEVSEEYRALADIVGVKTPKKAEELETAMGTLVTMFSRNREELRENAEKAKLLAAEFEKAQSEAVRFGINTSKAFDEAKKSIDRMAAGMPTRPISESVQAMYRFSVTSQDTSRALKALGLNTAGTQKTFSQLSGTLPIVERNFDGMADSEGDAEIATVKFNLAGVELSKTIAALGDGIGAVGGMLSQLGIISERASGAFGQISSGISGIGGGLSALKAAKNETNGLLSAFGQIGAYASIASAGIGILAGAFKLLKGKSGELKAIERATQGLVGMTKEWRKELEQLAKDIGGAGSASRALNQSLAEIIRTTDMTATSFTGYVNAVRNIISTMTQGYASSTETIRNFGNAFEAVVEKAQQMGLEGGQALTGLIMLADQFGLSIDQVTKYVQESTDLGLSGYKKVLETIDLGPLIQQQQELIDSMRGMKAGSDEFIEAQKKLKDLELQIANTTKLQGIFGDLSITVFDDILSLQKKIGENTELTDTIMAATDALAGYSNAYRLTEEQFDQFEKIAVGAFNELINQGFTASEAISSDTGLAGMLERLIYLQNEFGYTVDDSTQALIDQGLEAGALSGDFRDTTEIMRDGFQQVVEAIDGLTRAIRDDIPRAIDSFSDSSNAAFASARNNTQQWHDSLNDVADIISGDLVDATEYLDDQWHKALIGNTITKDTEIWQQFLENIDQKMYDMTDTFSLMDREYRQITIGAGNNTAFWEQALENIERQMAYALPDKMELLQRQYDLLMQAMAGSTNRLYIGLDGIVRTLEQTIGLQGQLTAPTVGGKYGVFTDKEKEEMSVQFKQLTHLWQSSRSTILSDKTDMAAFLRDLQGLQGGIIDSMIPEYEKFMKSIEQWNAHVQRGDVWNEATKSWTVGKTVASQYGMFSEAEIKKMTTEYQSLKKMWSENKMTIMATQSGMANFLRDLEQLQGGIAAEKTTGYNEFLKSIGQWASHVKAGEKWDDVAKQWTKGGLALAGGTGGMKRVPPGFSNDSFGPIWLSSGENFYVGRPGTDMAQQQQQQPIVNNYSFYPTINVAGKVTPESVMEAFYRGVQADTSGYWRRTQRILNG